MALSCALLSAASRRDILPFSIFSVVRHSLMCLAAPVARGASHLSLRHPLRQVVRWVLLVVDVDDLKRHTVYSGGYTRDSRTVAMFWEAVSGYTPAERRALLKFVTSSSRPPVQGFKHLHPPFTIHKVNCEAPSVFSFIGGSDVDRLPSASTCFNVLKLPNYKRSATMRDKVKYAVTSGAGFELS